MVSIFSGEVNRTWRFCDGGGQHHEVSLYHHPLTGARAALVDHEELEGSLGTSSVFHGSTTTIPFACGGCRGAIHIQRSALFGFSYACSADGVSVPEATSATKTGHASGSSEPSSSTATPKPYWRRLAPASPRGRRASKILAGR